jgi:hypothetical protein
MYKLQTCMMRGITSHAAYDSPRAPPNELINYLSHRIYIASMHGSIRV